MECYNYTFNIIDLIIPKIITDKICNSKEKTKLFIINLIRLIISLILLKYQNFFLIKIYVLINIIILLYTMCKIPIE